MSSIIKVNTVQDADGNNIINESGDVITVGASGDTVTVAGNVLKSNALQASDAGNIVSQSGTTITVGASGDTVALASGASQTGFGSNAFRNIIINGDMSVAQRATSKASVNTTGYYTCDRFQWLADYGVVTLSQDTDVPTGQGFAKSFKADVTTSATVSSGGYVLMRHRIEGQNLQYIKKGTSSAESLTVSFWVKSTKTGTYIAELYDADNTRQISKAYTVSSSNTWEKKELTFAGDTSGALGNDTGGSLFLNLYLSAGTNYTSGTLSTTWTAPTSANRVVGQVDFQDSTSNNFYVTGIQMEAGTSATDFEHIPFDINLSRCQRYYEKNFDYAIAPQGGQNYANTQTTNQAIAYTTSNLRHYVYFKTPKRTSGTATFYYVTGLAGGTNAGKWDVYTGSWTQTSGSTSASEMDENGFDLGISHSSFTFGLGYLIVGGWSVDAEL
jgi:hypothetical protein